VSSFLGGRNAACGNQQILGPLIPRARVRLWSDEQISAGDVWLREIQAAMERAAMAVLLGPP
jgi:hypothetical protein